MDQELRAKWFSMSVRDQISNIGSEVSRAIKWKNKGNEKRKVGFCLKSIEFLDLSMADPKNAHRVGEFSFCVEELKDYFLGDNTYCTTDEKLHKYYDAFI